MNLLHDLIETALRNSKERSAGQPHAKRSAEWVRTLADGLCNHCKYLTPDTSIVSFCRGNDANRSEFRTNELLFDILIAETKSINSVKGKQIQALSKTLWVVESELNRSDSRDVIIDLNKLVVGKSDNKLLVISSRTPLVKWAQGVMEQLLNPIESNVFLATIPHPEYWGSMSQPVSQVYQLTSDGWLTDHSTGLPSATGEFKN